MSHRYLNPALLTLGLCLSGAAPAAAQLQIGACCDLNGECSVVTQATCAVGGGTFLGEDSTCTVLAPESAVGFSAQGLPLTLAPRATVSSVIHVSPVPAPGAIQLDLDLIHERASDLRITLISPSQSMVTVWNHEALPGPHLALTRDVSGLIGPAMAGTWTLLVDDPVLGAGGVLRAWSLTFTPAASACAGACCTASGECTVESAAQCAALGRRFAGDATICAPGRCEPPDLGGCCTTNGSCLLTSSAGCGVVGGSYRGAGTTCDALCPVTLASGACCTGQTRSIQPLVFCSFNGGRYLGNDTTCSPVTAAGPVNPCCPADFNNSGELSVQDIFAFLASFFTGCP